MVTTSKKLRELSAIACYDCRHARLMQRENNPVIADCPQHGRKVAKARRTCPDFHHRREGERPAVERMERHTNGSNGRS